MILGVSLMGHFPWYNAGATGRAEATGLERRIALVCAALAIMALLLLVLVVTTEQTNDGGLTSAWKSRSAEGVRDPAKPMPPIRKSVGRAEADRAEKTSRKRTDAEVKDTGARETDAPPEFACMAASKRVEVLDRLVALIEEGSMGEARSEMLLSVAELGAQIARDTKVTSGQRFAPGCEGYEDPLPSLHDFLQRELAKHPLPASDREAVEEQMMQMVGDDNRR